MVLAVDIGNTNIVMGCFESDKILFVERLSTNQQSTALEYAIMLKNILEIHSIDINDFKGGIISSVVPSVTLTMKEAMERLIKKRIMVVGPGIKTGLKINLDNPHSNYFHDHICRHTSRCKNNAFFKSDMMQCRISYHLVQCIVSSNIFYRKYCLSCNT